MNGNASSRSKAGMTVRVKRADGEIVDFGEAVEGNPCSQWLQEFKIKLYAMRVKLERRT